MTEHPTRSELIQTLRSAGNEAVRQHIHSCTNCADLAELFDEFAVAGLPMLSGAPASWTSKAMAISCLEKTPGILERTMATLSFDSWTQNLVLGVRGGIEGERRLRFTSAEATADIRAEKRPHHWRFVARVSAPNVEPSDISLSVDGELLFPDQAGFLDWIGAKPPEELLIQVPAHIIAIPSIAWSYQK